MRGELHIELLGGFRLEYQGEQLDTAMTSRLQELLTWLVLNRDKSQSRQYVAFLFWPDSTEKQALTNLRNLLHLLREALPDADRFLIADNKTLQWNTEAPFTLDVADFEEAVTKAEQENDISRQVAALKAAAELHSGPLLPECYQEWITPHRDRLQQVNEGVLQALIELLERKRDFGQAIRYAKKRVRLDALNEAGWRRVMELHAQKNDRARAVEAYRECAGVLREELDIEPAPETRQLYERLLASFQDPTDTGHPGKDSAVDEEWSLVGRETEWQTIRGCWKKALSGDTRFLLIEGDPGIGKSRLGLEFLNTLCRQGYPVAYSRCYEAGCSLSYGPIIDWLREESVQARLDSLDDLWLAELVRLLPELLIDHPDLTHIVPDIESLQQRRLLEAITRGLTTGDKPRLLFIDDLQWCDGKTLEWINHVFHTIRSEKLLLVGSCRPVEAGSNKQVQQLLEDLRRQERMESISLKELSEQETAELASRMAGRPIDEETARKIYRETEGHPLFVVETVREGRWMDEEFSDEIDNSKEEMEGAVQPLPKKITEMISARFRRLSKQGRQLMEVAATTGQECSFTLLKQASELDEPDLIEALDEIIHHHILNEKNAGNYDFTHDKLREVAYGELSRARRQYLHERIIDAIETVYADNLHAYHGRLAWHYQQAGYKQKADTYYEKATVEARQILNDLQAAGYLEQSQELLEQIEQTRNDQNQMSGAEIPRENTLLIKSTSPLGNVILTKNKILASIGFLGVLLLLYTFAGNYFFSVSHPKINSIAVLPFRNLSAEGPYDFFAVGLHGELLTQLTKVEALKVINSTSVMEYTGPDTPPIRQIARDLGVGSIVEGSVQVLGKRLRVHVQLIDPDNEMQLWAERYDRTLDDAFAIQSDVAQQITTALGATLKAAEREQLTDATTANTKAYLLYLQGLEYWNRPAYLKQNYEIALQLFERALALDPGFALAQAALSQVHMWKYWYGYDRTQDRVELAREHAEEALRLAPDLPQAHIAMGEVYYRGYHEYKHALNEYTIALEGLPNNANLMELIGYVHRRQGNFDKALAMYEKAVRLDPRNADLIMNLGGWTFGCLGRYGEAERAFNRTLTFSPDYHLVAFSKGLIYLYWKGTLDTLRKVLTRLPANTKLGMGMGTVLDQRLNLLLLEQRPDSLLQIAPDNDYREIGMAHQMLGNRTAARAAFKSALARLDSVIQERRDYWPFHANRGLALAGLGRDDEALAEARWLQHSLEYRWDAIARLNIGRFLAPILAMAGETEAALSEIERMLSEPCSISVHELQLNPRFDPIRDHPRFKTLLAKYRER